MPQGHGHVYDAPALRELCPESYVAGCVEIGIGGVFVLPAFKNHSRAVTYRPTDVASLGSVLRWNYLNKYSFPTGFIHSEVFDFAVNPVGKPAVESLGLLSLLRSETAEIFDGDHGIISLGNLNYSLGYIVSNPVIYATDFSPESSYLLATSLPLRKFGLKVVNPFPIISNFIEQFTIFNKFNIADNSTCMQNSYHSLISQTNVNPNNSFRFSNINFLFDANNKVEPTISSDKLNSSELVLTLQSFFKQFSLVFPAFNRYCYPTVAPIYLNLEKEWKFLTMFKDGANSRNIHPNGKLINLRDRRLFFKLTIKPLLVKLSPRIKRLYNNISNFLNSWLPTSNVSLIWR